jgi:hypothetical protein
MVAGRKAAGPNDQHGDLAVIEARSAQGRKQAGSGRVAAEVKRGTSASNDFIGIVNPHEDDVNP